MPRLSLLALIGVTAVCVGAAPTSQNPYNLTTPVCGPPNSNGLDGICVDHDAITSKPFARYQADHTHYTFHECRAACDKTKECVSVAYYNTDNFDGLDFVCELLSVPITPYTIKCGSPKYGAGSTPFAQNNSAIGQAFNPASLNTSALSNYYEKSCPRNTIPVKTSGEIPTADGDQLICGAWTTTTQSYADLFLPTPGKNQTECRDLCKATPKCKSYWWNEFTGPTSQPFGQPQTSEPDVNGDCALFTQPARSHAVFSEYPLSIFDINCNPGNGTGL